MFLKKKKLMNKTPIISSGEHRATITASRNVYDYLIAAIPVLETEKLRNTLCC